MRRTRSLTITLVLGILGTVPTTAATPIGHRGHVGRYAVSDTPTDPGAICRYDPDAGNQVLGSIRVRPVAMWGLRNELQTVGYRLLLQQRMGGTWTTIAIGPLRTAKAEKDVGNGAPGSGVPRDAQRLTAGARYRAVLRLLWFSNDDRTVEGRLRVRIDHHRRTFDGSAGPACRGQVATPAQARAFVS